MSTLQQIWTEISLPIKKEVILSLSLVRACYILMRKLHAFLTEYQELKIYDHQTENMFRPQCTSSPSLQ